jgi:hypothetical protein
MSNDVFDPSELKISELPKPPGFGLVLSLLAILLTLAGVQLSAQLIQLALAERPDEALSLEWYTQLLMSCWALVNLVLLIKRRRLFIESMIALLAFNLLLSMLAIAGASQTTSPGSWPVFFKLSLVTGILWIVYLARSQHVRKVCVR